MKLYLSSRAAFSSVDEKMPTIKCRQKIDFVFNFHLTNILHFNGIIRVQKNLIFDPFSENNICSEVFSHKFFAHFLIFSFNSELISSSQHIFISLIICFRLWKWKRRDFVIVLLRWMAQFLFAVVSIATIITSLLLSNLLQMMLVDG